MTESCKRVSLGSCTTHQKSEQPTSQSYSNLVNANVNLKYSLEQSAPSSSFLKLSAGKAKVIKFPWEFRQINISQMDWTHRYCMTSSPSMLYTVKTRREVSATEFNPWCLMFVRWLETHWQKHTIKRASQGVGADNYKTGRQLQAATLTWAKVH